MILRINKNSKIRQIQQDFSKRFPYLKIEFFKDKNKDGELTADEMVKDPETTIGSIREMGHDGVFDIDGLTTVKELEKNFLDIFGVYVQVFRKSGSTWLMTTTTDHLTLAEQNHIAAEQSKPVTEEKPIDAADRAELE
jgi:hypothetical protein